MNPAALLHTKLQAQHKKMTQSHSAPTPTTALHFLASAEVYADLSTAVAAIPPLSAAVLQTRLAPAAWVHRKRGGFDT
ncbi:MAG TPA: hypothetical protein VG168_09545, partial [Bryobacteraceae bacterium]|nr:hypothetical protein [Bryobacteraceae bacterium]